MQSKRLLRYGKLDIFNVDEGSQFTSMDFTAVLKIAQSESYSTTAIGSSISTMSRHKKEDSI